MNIRTLVLVMMVFGALGLCSCSNAGPGTSKDGTSPAARGDGPAALPDNAFKAVITITDAPAKLRTGQKQVIQLKVKNASELFWYARGGAVNNNPDNKFYLAVGNRWFEADGQKLVTDMDGRNGLNRDLKPGEETDVTLVVTAPKSPGDYVLEVDLVQEQVAWFHEKGSPTARVNIKIER